MKMSIQWHKECQENAAAHYDRLRKKALEDLAFAMEGVEKTRFYRLQIEEAERRGMDSFDRDRLMKKK